jgi:hypothetical protein
MSTITVALTPQQAAALLRFTEKVTHSDAMGCLYGHKSQAQRDEQAYEIMAAFTVLEAELRRVGVRSWPWVETGRVLAP